MKRFSIGLIMVVVLTIVFLTPTASADEDALHVILLCERGPYESGESARLEVHVFDKGSHVEADKPPMASLRVEDRYDEYIYREQRTERISEGVYASEFEIFDSDGMTNDLAYIGLIDDVEVKEGRSAQVIRGWDGIEDTQYDFIESSGSSIKSIELIDPLGANEGLKIDYDLLTMDQYPWEPDDIIEFGIEVKDDGVLVKPDDFYVYADLNFPDLYDEYILPYNNPIDGSYRSRMTVPSKIDRPGSIDITMYAEYLGREAYSEFTLRVDKYQVWMRNTGGNNTMMSFDLYVADMYGQIVAGQEVGIIYYNNSGINRIHQVTDETGRVGITVLEHGSDSLDFMMWIDDGSFNQTLDTYIPHEIVQDLEDPDAPSPWGYGFEVLPMDHGIDPFTETERTFWAFNNGDPLNSTTIYYYVYSDREMISTGKAVTDEGGKFFATLSSPLLEFDSIHFDFQADHGYHPGIYVGYDWDDSDHDGYSDKFEIREGTDPNDRWDKPVKAQHSDWDGFTDEFEISMGTDPEDSLDYPIGYIDSDEDNFGDAYEESEGCDPYDPSDHPTDMPDADDDGYPDDFETANGTDPYSRWDHPDDLPDTDSDGICDGMELFYGTDPEDPFDFPVDKYLVNTDEDYVERPFGSDDEQYDLEEIFYGKDPRDPFNYPFDQYSKDTDGDSYCDEEENFYGTNPNDENDYPMNLYEIDSDHDGICDEEEYFYGSDPTDPYDAPDREPSPWDPRYDDHNSTDGKRYLVDSVEMYYTEMDILESEVDDTICMGMDLFTVGGLNDIWLKSVDLRSPSYGLLLIGGKEEVKAQILGEEEPQWRCLDGSNVIPFYCSGNEMRGCFAPPSFLPVLSQEYMIIGTQEEGLNYIVLHHGSSASVGSSGSGGDKDGFPMIIVFIGAPALIIMALIIVIVFIVILRAGKARGKKKESGTQRPFQPVPSGTLKVEGAPPQPGPTYPLQTPVRSVPPAQRSAQVPVQKPPGDRADPGFFADQPKPPVPPAPDRPAQPVRVQGPLSVPDPTSEGPPENPPPSVEPPKSDAFPPQQEPPISDTEEVHPVPGEGRQAPPSNAKTQNDKDDRFGLNDIIDP